MMPPVGPKKLASAWEEPRVWLRRGEALRVAVACTRVSPVTRMVPPRLERMLGAARPRTGLENTMPTLAVVAESAELKVTLFSE